ncbi:MAG: hypothetical protein HY537_09395 [Deltaproteobacteria bacterium]|nr:hypothetical protein [Deltaproteobacteria bacterium]
MSLPIVNFLVSVGLITSIAESSFVGHPALAGANELSASPPTSCSEAVTGRIEGSLVRKRGIAKLFKAEIAEDDKDLLAVRLVGVEAVQIALKNMP